ncbi:hypothetical protein [Streptomyces sp. Tue6028]|uniref:hypothetical protein n=1 Tax=Streptomyces sp. Tue6028 TaxID=2036037 RepID=UPI003EBFB7DF
MAQRLGGGVAAAQDAAAVTGEGMITAFAAEQVDTLLVLIGIAVNYTGPRGITTADCGTLRGPDVSAVSDRAAQGEAGALWESAGLERSHAAT